MSSRRHCDTEAAMFVPTRRSGESVRIVDDVTGTVLEDPVIRRMRFKEAYGGWRKRRLTQEEEARLLGGV